MSILNIGRLKGLFERKRSLDDITVDELRRERIALEQEEAKIVAKIEATEKQKQDLFVRGTQEASVHQKRILATKIKDLDVQAKQYGKGLAVLSRQLRVIGGFMQLKENQRLLELSGVSTLIAGLDLTTLQKYVDSASVEGVFQMDKFAEMLRTLEDGERLGLEADEDGDIAEIMQAFEEAKLAQAESPDAVAQMGKDRLDRILGGEEPAESEL